MKNCILTTFILSLAAGISALGQVNCAPSTPTNSPLVCLLPFTADGQLSIFKNAEAAQTTAQQAANSLAALNGPIGAQLSQLPLAASATSDLLLVVNGSMKQYDNLGPILIDRPDSVGKGVLAIGGSFQQFNFNHLDGIPLGSIPFVYSQSLPSADFSSRVACPSAGNCTFYAPQTQQIGLKYDQYVTVATYGLPNKTDISVILPFARATVQGAATGGTVYVLDSANTLIYDTASTSGSNPVRKSASGFGDVSFNVKHVLWGGGERHLGAFAAGASVRLATGSALNYLGSGSYGLNLYLLASYKALVSPHVKIANQWNSDSILLNPTGSGTNQKLPGGIQFAFGVDARLGNAKFRSVTLSADIIGNQSLNAPSFTVNKKFQVPYSTSVPQPAPANPITLTTVVLGNNSYTTTNLSTGIKWRPIRHLDMVLFGSVLTQLNDVGLRSDPAPSGGISFSFATPFSK